MKNIVIGFVSISMFSSVLVHADEIKTTKVDCDTVKVELSNMYSEIHPIVTWDGGSKFPNPPNPKMIDGTPYNFSCPNLSSSYDGNIFRKKAPDYERLLYWNSSEIAKLLPLNIRFYERISYIYPHIREGRTAYVHYINLGSNKVTLDDISESAKEVVIGYRVNNGDLKPLHYNGQFSDYKDDLSNADVLDIYYSYKDKKFGKKNIVERIHIDKPNGELVLYKSFKFPQK